MIAVISSYGTPESGYLLLTQRVMPTKKLLIPLYCGKKNHATFLLTYVPAPCSSLPPALPLMSSEE